MARQRHLQQMPDDPFIGHVRKEGIERLRRQAGRRAGMIFGSTYLLFLLAFTVALIVYSAFRDWDYFDVQLLPLGVLIGPALIAGVASSMYYMVATWDLPPTDD